MIKIINVYLWYSESSWLGLDNMGELALIHWIMIVVELVIVLLIGYNYYARSKSKSHIKSWQEFYKLLVRFIANHENGEFFCESYHIEAIEFICKHGLVVDGLMCVSTLNQNKTNLIIETKFDGEIYLCILNKDTKKGVLFIPNPNKSVMNEKLIEILEYQRFLI